MKSTLVGRVARSILAVTICVMSSSAEEPVGWRNDGSGAYPTRNPPIRWSAEEGVLWNTPLPGPSKGSPIIVGEFIFTQSYPNSLVCVSRADGKLLWQKTNGYADALPASEAERMERTHPVKAIRDLYWPAGDDSSQTTPVSDGQFVFCAFGNGVVSAYSLNGTRKWIRFIEHPEIGYGLGCSPVLAGDYLIVHLNDLLAIDPKTGCEVWRTELAASHATPAVTRIGNEDVLVHPSGAIVRASDGNILARDLFDSDRASPIVLGNTIYVHGEAAFHAVRLPESVGVAPSDLWETKATHGGYTIASPILHGGQLFGVNRKGILEVIDAKSGELTYRERLPFDKVYSGLALAGGLLYIGNEKGTHLVLRPGDKYEEVARNELGEMIDASPVFANDRLYLRGEKHLFCIGK
ncbi:MAG: PQQ-binding-like beta-propeller repeat protein [Planctomycetota bacterium]|nr:PQQ-binding-like beta-propeller repeat protein [Planctomycetota bacterium]